MNLRRALILMGIVGIGFFGVILFHAENERRLVTEGMAFCDGLVPKLLAEKQASGSFPPGIQHLVDLESLPAILRDPENAATWYSSEGDRFFFTVKLRHSAASELFSIY